MNINPQDILEEFFVNDTRHIVNKSSKKSVFLAIINDLEFCLSYHKRWREVELTTDQRKKLQRILPTFAIISIFCSAVDVIARVTNKRTPSIGENKKYFVNCAVKYYHLDNLQAQQLWQLRNSISHQYVLSKGTAVLSSGSSKIIESKPNNRWVFYLTGMLSTTLKVKDEIYKMLTDETESKKLKTQEYLLKSGFFYTPAEW